MVIRFNKSEVAFINNLQKNSISKNNTMNNAKVNVPSEESFSYILEKAKSGNEMAAVQIDEWSRFCKPRNNKEEITLNKIKDATKEIFE